MIRDVYLQHHGTKGMQWGIRRFQNKDGSLTPLGKKRAGAKTDGDDEKEDTVEERRKKALSSVDAGEIYKNKDVLTTAEINERLTRIDTEARLGRVAESTKKTGMDRVDTALKYFNKVNEVYEASNKPLGKALKKLIGGEAEKHMSPDIKKVWDNRDKLTDEQLTKALKRSNTEKAIRNLVDEMDKAKNENAAGSKKPDSKPDEKADKKTETGTVEGEGTSSYSGEKKGPIVDAEEGTDYRNVDKNTYDSGERYITGLLGEKKKKRGS